MVRIGCETTDCPDIMKPAESALHVRGLTKRFDRLAVDALDLTIQSGEFYALVGPNGAGKTTTLRMVAGLSRPDAGSVAVFGVDALGDPVAAKQMMAWVSDEPMIYDKLTPLEYLEFVAGLWGVDPVVSGRSARDLLVSLGLEPHLHERCEGFSKGMRQKVALAGALVHDPRLIILDEPLTGLDAVSARHVKGFQPGIACARLQRDRQHILESPNAWPTGSASSPRDGLSPKAPSPNCASRTGTRIPASKTSSSRL
jgi:ABC-2 type transport system ATP-binding protein